MPRVLFVSQNDPSEELGRGALFAEDVERRWIREPSSALELARLMQPRLVYIDLPDAERARSLIRELRGDEVTRPTAIAVVSHTPGAASERSFDAAGATVVGLHTHSGSGILTPQHWRKVAILLPGQGEVEVFEAPGTITSLAWPFPWPLVEE